MPNVKKKRVFLIGGIVAAVIILVAIAYGIWALFLAPPSRDDYKQAVTKGEKILGYNGLELLRAHSSKVVNEARKGKTSERLVQAAQSERNKALDAINSRAKLADELGRSRVMKDEEVKKAYDTYRSRETRYGNYIRDYSEAFPYYLSSLTTCKGQFNVLKTTSDDKKVANAHKESLVPCTRDLEKLEKSPITPYADYAKEFKRINTERQKVLDELSKGNKSRLDIVPQLEKLSADVTKNDPLEGIRKYGNDAVFSGQLTAVIDILKKKSES